MYIVIVGTLFGSKTVHGTFGNATAAGQWAQENAGNQHFEVVPLLKPVEQKQKKLVLVDVDGI